jgi:nicotinate phosphoribosyltransferase
MWFGLGRKCKRGNRWGKKNHKEIGLIVKHKKFTLEVLSMRRPTHAFEETKDMWAMVDYYEHTSGQADLDHGYNDRVTFSYFFRKIPEYLGSYVVSAGLEQVAYYILNLRFPERKIRRMQKRAEKDFKENYVEHLLNYKWTGDVWAVPEGTIIFPNEPAIQVTGPSIYSRLFETHVLQQMNTQSLIATKFSRCYNAANGRTIIDFGARRAKNPLLSARAAYIGGTIGTSYVLAWDKWKDIQCIGTMPHLFIQERIRDKPNPKEAELLSFLHYGESMPHNVKLLIDTYESIQGVKNAIEAYKWLAKRGSKVLGIRFDSGDILSLTKDARKMLDDEGLSDVHVYASSDLDEYRIQDLLSKGAPIDSFGVGSRGVDGSNYDSINNKGGVSLLNGIYKLVEIENKGKKIPVIKTSDFDKKTLPGRKQVWRRIEDRMFIEDEITLWDEKPSIPNAHPLLCCPITINGKQEYDFPRLKKIRGNTIQNLSSLSDEIKKLDGPVKYPVKISSKLQELTNRLYENCKVV